MPISVRPLTPAFGAEITNVDLTRALNDATFAEVENAFETYSVLVFPQQNLTDESQIAFSSRFGALETTQGHIANNFTVRQVSVISNLDPNGKLMKADDPRLIYRLGQRNWHSDSSFKKVPAKASLLHARLLPPEGGQTQFASLRAAYDALPDAMKKKLHGLVAEHCIRHSRQRSGFSEFNEDEQRRLPPVPQMLVRTISPHGRKSLYVASHAGQIFGMTDAESRALIDELIAHATQRQFVYTHRWRPNELVMWDNRCTMHRGTEYDDLRWVRDMRRVTISDVANTCEQEGVPLPAPAAARRTAQRVS